MRAASAARGCLCASTPATPRGMLDTAVLKCLRRSMLCQHGLLPAGGQASLCMSCDTTVTGCLSACPSVRPSV
eukprot:5701551-Alexandrium_andersonii.AAC.1